MADETTNNAAQEENTQGTTDTQQETASTVDLSTLTAEMLLTRSEEEVAEVKTKIAELKKEVADVEAVYKAYLKAKAKESVSTKIAYIKEHKNVICCWLAFIGCIIARKMGLL